MKIVNLKRIEKFTDREMWTFNLSVGGFIINGWVYSRDKGSVMAPSYGCGPRKRRTVKAFGMQMKRLKALLEEEIEKAAIKPPLPLWAS